MSDASKAGSKHSPTDRSVLGDAGISRAPEPSLAAHESAQRFVERLSARAPETARYKDEGEIARGGMGAIVRVWDEVLRRTLAMKVLLERPKSSDDGDSSSQDTRSVMLARFVEEAQVTGQLDHPGIVPVHDVGVDAAGRVWFTMRLIKGRNLEEVLELVHGAREGWTTTRAVQVLLRVCEAMAFAHAKGVVHRDLKPANVMVGRFGETYVMDWGLARVAGAPEIAGMQLSVHGAGGSSTVRSARGPATSSSGGASPQLTLAGSVVGTPAYMPPEQARGAIDEVDERSDVYAVGAMLYQLLARHRPYSPPGTKPNALEVLRAVQAGAPAPLATFAREAPAELVAICEKAMAREKDARYASMLLLAEDLQAYLEGRVVRAHRTGARAELVKWVGRNKLAAAALAFAALLAVGGLGSIAWVQHEANAELAVARDAALLQSYGSNLSAASASLSLDAVDEARRRLAACDAGLRGWEWSHLALAASPRAREIVVSDRSVDRVAWSPDGRTLATWCGDVLAFWDLERGERRAELRAGGDDAHVMAWSPDGELVATAEPSFAITVWSARDAKPVRVLAGHSSPVAALRFSPDGKRLYSSAGNPLGAGWKSSSSSPKPRAASAAASGAPEDDGHVFAWDVAKGTLELTLGAPGAMVGGIFVDESGRRLACVDREGVVRVWDVEARAALASRRFPATVVRVVAFEETGAEREPELLVVTSNLGMQRWDARLEQLLASREDAETIAGLAGGWLLGPLHLATRRGTGNLRVFDRHDFTPVCELHVGADEAESVAFDPTGRWLACGGKNGVVTLWNPEVAAADYDLPLPEWNVRGLAFTPDGERVVAGSTWGRVAVLDARTGATLVTQRIPRGGVRMLCVSRDGARVAAAHEKGVYVLRTEDLAQIAEAEGEWRACAFAGDTVVAGGEDGTVAWIDAAERREAVVARASDAKHSAAVNCVAASADGTTCATGARDGSVIVWDARARRARASAASGGSAPIVALVLAGGAVIAADERGHHLRFDAASGALLADVAAQEKPFVALVAAPDASRLYTSGQDGLLRVWQPESLLSVATLAQSGARVEELAVSRDGARVACALDRGAVRVLESRARDLHAEERARHIATERRAKALVTELARALGSVRAVEARVAADAELPPEVRSAVLEPLRALRDEARAAHRQSWRIVQQRDEGASAYRSALALAERAWRLEPERDPHLEALALAHLRAGDAARALDVLEGRATKSDGASAGRPGAAAIRALALVRLGDRERAREEARRARELLRSDDAKDLDARPIVLEAEAAVGDEAPR